jgi:hypothetical protein
MPQFRHFNDTQRTRNTKVRNFSNEIATTIATVVDDDTSIDSNSLDNNYFEKCVRKSCQ